MVMLLLYITYKRFFLRLAWVVPRLELGGRTGFERSNIYQEFLVSFFYTYHYVDFGKRGSLEEGQRLGLLA